MSFRRLWDYQTSDRAQLRPFCTLHVSLKFDRALVSQTSMSVTTCLRLPVLSCSSNSVCYMYLGHYFSHPNSTATCFVLAGIRDVFWTAHEIANWENSYCTWSCVAAFSGILVIFWFHRSTETLRSRSASMPVVGYRRSSTSHLPAVPPVPPPPYRVHLRHWTTLAVSRGGRPVVSAYLASLRRWLLRRSWRPTRQRRGRQPCDDTDLSGETWALGGRH